MATSVAVLPAKLESILMDVEDILLESANDRTLLAESERQLLVDTERVMTTAVEDGKGFSMPYGLFDLLTDHTDIGTADFVGGVIPTSKALDKWTKSNPLECTEDFDGICRCKFGR